jgi:SAM-dependent methyltransferase
MSSTTPAVDHYFLGYRDAEQRRLRRQTEQLAGETAWLLDRAGPLDGGRVVELGCGPRGYLDALSERVGLSGTVVGVERSADALELARKFVARRGLDNVELVHGDARSTGLPGAAFDLATARLVLVNVPQPEEIVAETVRLARPGGTVAFREADALTDVCDPPLEAWTRLRELRRQPKGTTARAGADRASRAGPPPSRGEATRRGPHHPRCLAPLHPGLGTQARLTRPERRRPGRAPPYEARQVSLCWYQP